MTLDQVRNFQETKFQIPRYIDKIFVQKFDSLVEEGQYKITKSRFKFTFTDNNIVFAKDDSLNEILNLSTISTTIISFQLENSLIISLRRDWDQNTGTFKGNQDTLAISQDSSVQSQITATEFVKLIALARKHFGATDTKPFMDFLNEDAKQLYQAREQDLQKLERMQENFFKNMAEFTFNQQIKQQEFQRQLESEYASRQSKLQEQHEERLKQFEQKEAELKKIRSEIDERENRQARRDIYKELKTKLDARNKTFELTEGTQNRREFTFWFIVGLLVLFASVFGYCFFKNVVNDTTQTNWIAVGSQIGFAVAFIGLATFFIRWNNQWFQQHADEEFKLKRLDLDIDRANWLVELAMEWKNITKSEIPTELVDKLARSLFVSDESKEINVHPAETLLSALFGKAGSINMEFPGKLTMQRSDDGESKSTSASKK